MYDSLQFYNTPDSVGKLNFNWFFQMESTGGKCVYNIFRHSFFDLGRARNGSALLKWIGITQA
jgi:hypothetical protein